MNEIERLRTALEFYATEGNWLALATREFGSLSPAEADEGKRAREALKKAEQALAVGDKVKISGVWDRSFVFEGIVTSVFEG